MNYSNYSTLDFVMDEYFQQWVLAPTEEHEAYWQNWLENNPEKKVVIEEAKKLIMMHRVEEKKLSVTRIEHMLDGIKQGIKHEQPAMSASRSAVPSSRSRNFLSSRYKIAAVFLGFIAMAGAVYGLFFNSQTSYATAYGEVKEIVLPDGSQVTLNGNSRLHFTSQWQAGGAREVWLEGEAFFLVQNISQGASLKDENIPEDYKFVVHSHDLNVIVLGTQFNVNSRDDQVQVVLNSGKVKINIAHNNPGNEIFMEPGEMVAYDILHKTIGKHMVNPNNYSSWRKNILFFDEVPLYEVAKILENTYGLQITFENEELGLKIIHGKVPSDDISVLLAALPQTFGIKVSRQGNQIFISKK